MCPNSNPEPSPSVGDSAPPAAGTWSLVGFVNGIKMGEVEFRPATTKCSVCKRSTETEFITVMPNNFAADSNPMDRLKLAKRLSICTQCGNLRLTN